MRYYTYQLIAFVVFVLPVLSLTMQKDQRAPVNPSPILARMTPERAQYLAGVVHPGYIPLRKTSSLAENIRDCRLHNMSTKDFFIVSNALRNSPKS